MTIDEARKLKAGDVVYVATCFPGTPTRINTKIVGRDHNHMEKLHVNHIDLRDCAARIEDVHHTYEQARERICAKLRVRIGKAQTELAEWSKA